MGGGRYVVNAVRGVGSVRLCDTGDHSKDFELTLRGMGTTRKFQGSDINGLYNNSSGYCEENRLGAEGGEAD